jgi:hypothetical protein
MRPTIRRMVAVGVFVACFALGSLGSAAAYGLDGEDPSLFGAEDKWDFRPTLAPGDSGPWVKRLQDRLVESGFRPGVSDGRYEQATVGAVYAFQKLHGLDLDAVFRAEYWGLLDVPVELPVQAEVPHRVEIDLGKQVLYLVKDHQVEAVLPISSGNGGTYRGLSGASVRARTPEGDYQLYKRVEGWRISYLGGLYRPFYFRGGYAIHGSKSVPPYPASHGCVRVELHDMDYLTTELELGMSVYVYGQRLNRDDVVPLVPPPLPKWEDLIPGMPL